MFVKYNLSLNNTNERISEIGEFKSIYYSNDYESLVIKIKSLLPIYLPINSIYEMNSFTEELANKIKNNEAIIEIEGLVFNIEDDEDYDDYLSPEKFKEIREALKGYTRYSIN